MLLLNILQQMILLTQILLLPINSQLIIKLMVKLMTQLETIHTNQQMNLILKIITIQLQKIILINLLSFLNLPNPTILKTMKVMLQQTKEMIISMIKLMMKQTILLLLMMQIKLMINLKLMMIPTKLPKKMIHMTHLNQVLQMIRLTQQHKNTHLQKRTKTKHMTRLMIPSQLKKIHMMQVMKETTIQQTITQLHLHTQVIWKKQREMTATLSTLPILTKIMFLKDTNLLKKVGTKMDTNREEAESITIMMITVTLEVTTPSLTMINIIIEKITSKHLTLPMLMTQLLKTSTLELIFSKTKQESECARNTILRIPNFLIIIIL